MPDLVKLLRRLADEYETEEKGDLTAAQEARLAKLEETLAAAATPEEKRDALDDLPDDERALILAHRAGRDAVNEEPEGEPDDDDEEEPETEPDRPRLRLTRQIPRIWGGQDEPDYLEYVDEDGKVKTRPGRKRGAPYEWQIDELKQEAEAS